MLDRLVDAAAADIRVRHAVNQAAVLRGFAEARYAAKSWDKGSGSWPGSRPAAATPIKHVARRPDSPPLAAGAHLLRANSGFAREELMAWCEANGVHFLFGLAKTDRLIAEIRAELEGLRRRAGVPASRRGARAA